MAVILLYSKSAHSVHLQLLYSRPITMRVRSNVVQKTHISPEPHEPIFTKVDTMGRLAGLITHDNF